MVAAPKVTILCLAYNQEKFIKQALDGFLMQQTDFAFEVIINDDASTDNTAKIIKEYSRATPEVIKPIFQKTNQFSSGSAEFINKMFRAAKGEYIAFCEGDDFWTDPTKLQRQVDFLESHPDHALCFHPVRVFFENGEEEDSIYPEDNEASKFTVAELLKRNFIQTNTVMYRRQNYKNLATNIMPRDWYWHLYHAQFGKIGFINRTMAAYRRHKGGVWWTSFKNRDMFWRKNGSLHLNLFRELLNIYGRNPSYAKIINADAVRTVGEIISANDGKETPIARLVSDFPDFTAKFIVHAGKDLQDLMRSSAEKNRASEDKIRVLEKEVTELQSKNNALLQSRALRVGNIILWGPRKIKRLLTR